MMTGEVLLGGDEPDSLPLRGLPSGLRYQSPHFPRAVGHSWQARRPFYNYAKSTAYYAKTR